MIITTLPIYQNLPRAPHLLAGIPTHAQTRIGKLIKAQELYTKVGGIEQRTQEALVLFRDGFSSFAFSCLLTNYRTKDLLQTQAVASSDVALKRIQLWSDDPFTVVAA